MKSVKTNEKQGRSLAVLIFDAYNEYKSKFYPKDPAVYVIRAHPNTIPKIVQYFSSLAGAPNKVGAVTKDMSGYRIWGMRLEADPRLKEETIVFGPETVEIKWTGK